MIANIIAYVLAYMTENGLALLYKWLLALGVFFIIQFIIKIMRIELELRLAIIYMITFQASSCRP